MRAVDGELRISLPWPYEGIHGGRGYGTHHWEGNKILEFGNAADMVVLSTMFLKRNIKLITEQSGEHSTLIDYI